MTKFRTGHDAPKRPSNKPVDPPGTVPANRIPVYDHRGNMRGTVSHKASSAGVSRLTGTHNNKLGRKGGRLAWLGSKTLAEVSAMGSVGTFKPGGNS